MKRISLTVGIPAYNEELNIKFLLESLLKQQLKKVHLKEIIVVSDGSSDRTLEIAGSVEDKRIKVLEQEERIGGRAVQNEIVRLAKGDILVMLDADVLPSGSHFIEEIAGPIIDDRQVGLVGADTQSIEPKTFIEKVIATSHELKKSLYRKINHSDNLYLCHGRARAFSRDFYMQIYWPENAPEDAYSYLLCMRRGFKFCYHPKAKVIFRSPATLTDHFRQSTRFVKGKTEMERYFPGSFVKKQYKYTKLLLVRTVIEYLLKKPTVTLSYIVLTVYIRIFGIKKEINHAKWEISETTKRVVHDKV